MAEDDAGQATGKLHEEPVPPTPAVEGSATPASSTRAVKSDAYELREEDSSTIEARAAYSTSREEGKLDQASLNASSPSLHELSEDDDKPGIGTSSSVSSLFYTPAHSLVHVDFTRGVADRNSSPKPDNETQAEDTQQPSSSLISSSREPDARPSQEGRASAAEPTTAVEPATVGPSAATVEATQPAAITRPPPTGFRRIAREVLIFLGYGRGNERRKWLVSLTWTIGYCFIQVSLSFL